MVVRNEGPAAARVLRRRGRRCGCARALQQRGDLLADGRLPVGGACCGRDPGHLSRPAGQRPSAAVEVRCIEDTGAIVTELERLGQCGPAAEARRARRPAGRLQHEILRSAPVRGHRHLDYGKHPRAGRGLESVQQVQLTAKNRPPRQGESGHEPPAAMPRPGAAAWPLRPMPTTPRSTARSPPARWSRTSSSSSTPRAAWRRPTSRGISTTPASPTPASTTGTRFTTKRKKVGTCSRAVSAISPAPASRPIWRPRATRRIPRSRAAPPSAATAPRATSFGPGTIATTCSKTIPTATAAASTSPRTC